MHLQLTIKPLSQDDRIKIIRGLQNTIKEWGYNWIIVPENTKIKNDLTDEEIDDIVLVEEIPLDNGKVDYNDVNALATRIYASAYSYFGKYDAMFSVCLTVE